MNIVIMAGGGGTRLWPLSRQDLPKQFLKLDGKKTLLETTYNRAAQLVTADSIYVATRSDYGEKIQTLLPTLKPNHIFFEPERRDTAPAFAAVAAQLALRGQGSEPVIFMWSDHIFTAEKDYLEDVRKMPTILQQHPQAMVIMGHVPTAPETGLGYIEGGEKIAGFGDVFTVQSFKEKPDVVTAEQYVASGKYFWNIGSICALPNYIIEQLKTLEPDMMAAVEEFARCQEKGDAAGAAAAYGQARKISIDYALLEKTSPIFVVTGDYGWSDIGNWATIHDIFGINGDHDPHGHHVHVDSKNNYIYNSTGKAVSLIGMQNTIVVVTDDAVLITDKSKAHKVKDVVAKLEGDGKQEYL